MKTILIILAILIISPSGVLAQSRYFSKNGVVEFYSKTDIENIHGKNKTANAVIDTKTGAVQFSVLLKGFEFPKALMQEHFNDNYVESHKFPKAEFRGTIININTVNFAKDGSYPALVRGRFTLHGVTKSIEAGGIIKLNNQTISVESAYNILLSDYNIRIPAVVKDKISNAIKITVSSNLQPLK